MPTVESGQRDLVWAQKDAAVVVNNNDIADEITDSPYVNLADAAANDILPDVVNFSFDISIASAGHNMLVYAIFSEDGVENPPPDSEENKKILVASLTGTGTLTRSNISSVSVLGRYFRLAYQNDNSGAPVTIGSRYAPGFLQSYTA